MTILSYGRARRRLRVSRSWFIPIAMFVSLGIFYLVWSSRFHYVSICPICGKIESTVNWQLPFTDTTYWTNNKVVDTPLSYALASSGQVNPHQHDWHFVTGSGNRIRCALGDGGRLWTISSSAPTASFIKATYKFGSSQKIEVVSTCLHDLKHADNLRFFAGFPVNAENDRAAYMKWINQNDNLWDFIKPRE